MKRLTILRRLLELLEQEVPHLVLSKAGMLTDNSAPIIGIDKTETHVFSELWQLPLEVCLKRRFEPPLRPPITDQTTAAFP